MRLRIYKHAICAGSQSLSSVKNLESERGRSFTADPVSALPTTPGIFSTNSSSSSRCLLDVCLDLWGFEEVVRYDVCVTHWYIECDGMACKGDE